ncbi:NAD-dependent deacylase [Roseicella aquatilis]|uniref:NAD-dependent protein deacylase n=1 Tax=Roseicella aquatilis TaxID=2527868 RepID=A0A4R4DNA0_9PROT|nr:NAD-dependent deacylase [Roseicella aquatilis]TCZ63027.1 NAD-dependent deacylase [Roseicella aquatilis]
MTAPRNIVVLTGAGISRESGLHTFRDPDGIWQRVRIEDVATPEAFARDPARVQAFYDARRAQLRDPAVQPNAAHRALAELDRRWPGEFLLVTQNVDDLHGRAGARRLLPMHGELAKARCLRCDTVQASPPRLGDAPPCAACGAAALRPHIVWFGEMPLGMERIDAALAACDLFVSIGTSGNVYPAAGFVAEVRGRARTLELNLEPSEGTRFFDEARHGPATALVPEFVAALLEHLQADSAP